MIIELKGNKKKIRRIYEIKKRFDEGGLDIRMRE